MVLVCRACRMGIYDDLSLSVVFISLIHHFICYIYICFLFLIKPLLSLSSPALPITLNPQSLTTCLTSLPAFSWHPYPSSVVSRRATTARDRRYRHLGAGPGRHAAAGGSRQIALVGRGSRRAPHTFSRGESG